MKLSCLPLKKLGYISSSLFLISCSVAYASGVEEFKEPDQKPIVRVQSEELLEIMLAESPGEEALAKEALSKGYEASPRAVQKSFYGLSFPINPEILKRLMNECKGKVVAELGAADGVNSVCLGLAGAKKIYVNDIAKEELEHFLDYIRKAKRQKTMDRFAPIQGSFFKLITYEAILPHAIDILYARNVLHLIPPLRHQEFFDLAKTLLATHQSRIVLNVNSRDTWQNQDDNPEAKDFLFTSERLVLAIPGQLPKVLGAHKEPYLEDPAQFDPLKPQNIPLVDFKLRVEEALGLYRLHQENMPSNEALKNSLQQHIKLATTLNTRQQGVEIRLLKSHEILFTPATMSALLACHGFEVLSYDLIGPKGHILPKVGAKAQFLNVFAKLPSPPPEKEKTCHVM